MTEKEQQIAIATVSGWRFIRDDGSYYAEGIHGIPPHKSANECNETSLPDYLNDLNAIHEVEKYLRNEQKGTMINNLCIVVTRDHDPELGPMTAITEAFFASASQRVEALLRTLGLWKD